MIITSTAVIKSRLSNVQTLVDTIIAGTKVPDRIYFFIGEEPHFLDEGIKPHEIPVINDSRVEFIYTTNIGSIRKFIPAVKMFWTRPETKIIIIDDDRKVPPDAIEKLVKFSEEYPDIACGTAGNIYRFNDEEGRKGLTRQERVFGRKIVLGWGAETENTQVDLLNSGMLSLVKPRFFHEDILQWEKYITEFHVDESDEHFLNYLLAMKKTNRFVISINSCPAQMPAPKAISNNKSVAFYKARQSRAWNNIMQEWKTKK